MIKFLNTAYVLIEEVYRFHYNTLRKEKKIGCSNQIIENH